MTHDASRHQKNWRGATESDLSEGCEGGALLRPREDLADVGAGGDVSVYRRERLRQCGVLA